MKYWAACAGTLFDWPRKLVPYYRNHLMGCYSRSIVMIDSGFGRPGTVEEILHAQISADADFGVSPDIVGGAELTVARTKEWLPAAKEKAPKMQRVVALQGTPDDMFKQIELFHSDANLFAIGGLLKQETEAREKYLRLIVPAIHQAGKQAHALGIGSSRRDMIVMRELGVDSFDTSTPVQYAKSGCVFDSQLKKRYVGGPRHEEYKRNLLRLNCAMLQFVAENGFEPMQESFLQEWYSEVEYA